MKRREFTQLLGATTGIVTVAPLEFTAGNEGHRDIHRTRAGGEASERHALNLKFGDVRLFVAS